MEYLRWFAIILFIFVVIGCSSREENRILRLGTTTSVNDTELLDALSKKLKQEKNIEIQWISVGTGKALLLGKNCDVDIVLTHAPEAEAEAIKEGYLQERIPIMENYFILVGPSSRQESLEGTNTEEILQEIAKKEYSFISRGDDSGTHKKERSLWQSIGVNKELLQSEWYMETGQGMLQSLIIAEEKEGFTITDIATWHKFKSSYPESRLVVYTNNDVALVNTYSTLFINKERCTKVQDELAREFSAWLLSQPIQEYIGSYMLHNQPVFFPLYKDGMPK